MSTSFSTVQFRVYTTVTVLFQYINHLATPWRHYRGKQNEYRRRGENKYLIYVVVSLFEEANILIKILFNAVTKHFSVHLKGGEGSPVSRLFKALFLATKLRLFRHGVKRVPSSKVRWVEIIVMSS